MDDESLACGKKLHCHVLKFGLGCNIYVLNGLVQMHSLCGLMDMARGVFDRGRKEDVFSWNLMISGDKDLCTRVHGYVSDCTREPTLKLMNALVNAYDAACGEMDIAVRIFNNMKTRDVVSWTCIVKGFLDIGNLELARTYFDDMPVRDRISWAIMIDGYLLNYCSRLVNTLTGALDHVCEAYMGDS
ncbi:hypothetical protein F2Q69_00038218 [Brassica cretica]|uniref:Pentatricopeptide repeat-containing protein n=1 Tax=Brassica cretica TaxID=69181 RepID=A0A8S9SR43_BRACR|nr:hypothetical protein F2Q69_00038218 [Brassica cretica]